AWGEPQPAPRNRSGFGDVGDANARMRMGRARDHRVQRAVGGMVGDVAAAAADEGVVVFAREGPAETEFGRWHRRVYSAGAGGASGARRRRRVFSAIQRQTT